MDAADLYLSLLKKSILNELYIENEARLVYYATCSAGQHMPDPVVVREITTRRPDILAKLPAVRARRGIDSRNSSCRINLIGNTAAPAQNSVSRRLASRNG